MKSNIKIEIESNPEVRFNVIYRAIKMFYEAERDKDKKINDGTVSALGCEAYCILEDLKEYEKKLVDKFIPDSCK